MFRYPLLFSLLIPLGFLGYKMFTNRKFYRTPSLEQWKKGGQTSRKQLWWLGEIWILGILATIIYLLAGPETIISSQEVQDSGLTLAVVLDRSGSMGVQLKEDDPETRFEAVKKVLKEFLSRRQGDGITLISFARYPETHTPVTRSPDIIQGFLELIPLALEESESGTAIGDALVLSAVRLKEGKSKENPGTLVVLLLTDGRQNEGKNSPEEGAKTLASQGIKLFTIGLGGTGYYRQTGPFGSILAGQTVDLDVNGLTEIAKITGGEYFQADTPGELESLLKTLEKGTLSKLSRQEVLPRTLNLEAGLIILALLVFSYPGIRYFLLRRSLE